MDVELKRIAARAKARLRYIANRGLLTATLVADPPWMFNNLWLHKNGAAKHYRVLTHQSILDFPLPPLAPDCRLFLWRVGSQQEEALNVVRAWGFKTKAEMVWLKRTSLGNRHFGMGRQVRYEHETCLIATRGSPIRLAHVRSTFEAQTGKHSEKPEEFYKLVEQISPPPYVELFARRARPGWICLGDEAPSSDQPEEEQHDVA